MSGVRAPRKAKRTRAIIHGSGGSGRASGHAKIVTFTPAKTRRGRTIYEEVTDWRYYRASSSEEDETPTRKKIKSPRGAAGDGDLPDRFSQFMDEQFPGNFPTFVRRKTKVRTIVRFGPI